MLLDDLVLAKMNPRGTCNTGVSSPHESDSGRFTVAGGRSESETLSDRLFRVVAGSSWAWIRIVSDRIRTHEMEIDREIRHSGNLHENRRSMPLHGSLPRDSFPHAPLRRGSFLRGSTRLDSTLSGKSRFVLENSWTSQDDHSIPAPADER